MHYDTPFNNIFENGIVAPRIYFAADGSASLEYSTSVLTLTGAQLALPDGTAAAPSLKVGDEQNGLYSPSAGALGFAVAGTAVGVFNSSGVLVMYYGGTVPDGTAAAPSLKVGDEQNGLFSPAASNLGIATNGVERMRVDSGGNVGINATPSAWSTSYRALEVGRAGNGLWAATGTNYLALSVNQYYDGTNFKYSNTTTAGLLELYGNELRYYNAASGTAGNNITWAGRFTIDANGNMGLNGCTPASAWNTGYAGVQLGSGVDAFMAPTSSLGNLWLLSNAYYHTDNNFKYTVSSAAAWSMMLSSANDSFNIQSAASGTAGNSITFTVQLALQRDKSLALKGASCQSGTGISFPASQSASSDANTLDDYEEGTYTPTITPYTGSFTTASATGSYVKVGKMVQVWIDFTLTTIGTGTGPVYLSLPFTPAVAASAHARETNGTGYTYNGITSGTGIYLYRYDNIGGLGSGYRWYISLVFTV